ncbi:MFS transporter [Metabacillus sp. GX 13764]|uniref:MFS transporter n=1 Tax=Metabacillus kandeliae TaxID=2900151 RepID=UPI001E4D666D|nr:MFS transporter [Metabacillus kandeliae]MCD7033593.1 MFS transporter [Metabacillus kandeliae]
MTVKNQYMAENLMVPFQKRAVFTFSSTHFINDLVTTGMVPALVVLYKEAMHLSYTQASLIVLISYLTSSVSQPLFGMMADRSPRVWLFSAGVFLSVLGLALTGAAPSYGWLLFFVALSGLGSGAFHPEASRGTHLAAGSQKGLSQAIFQVGGNAGQAFGPLMIPLFLVHTGIQGLLWLIPLAFLSIILTGQILKWLGGRVKESFQKKKELEGENNYTGVALLTLIIVLRSWCQVGVVVFLPFYLKDLTVSQSEMLNFVFVGAGAAGTFIGGVFADRTGMKRLLSLSLFLAAPFALLFPHLSGILSVLDLLLFGFCVLSSFSVTVVLMQAMLPKNIAAASGLAIGFGVGAGGIGSVLMGGLSDIFGVASVFVMLSFLPLLAGILSLFMPNDRLHAAK